MSMTAASFNDSGSGRKTHIFQGDYHVSRDPNEVVSTILGSCVAACVRDPFAAIGGMNHFLLPGKIEGTNSDNHALAAGVHLMELLINGLLREGARRDRLEAKIFGGARTVKSLSDIGALNVNFATRFLQMEGIAIKPGSTGGTSGRRLQFWPATGRIRQGLISPTTAELEPPRPISSCVKPNAGEVELF